MAKSAHRCGKCGRCGFCSPRMIRLADDLVDSNAANDARAERALEVKENVYLEKLARALIEQNIRPEILREDVTFDLTRWLRDMLVGPALPLNKEKNFVEDALQSTDFCSDAEIFVETLPGCHEGMIERNRADAKKKSVFPDPDSPLRVREDVLRNRCIAMVNHFANKKGVTDELLKKTAADDFFNFYRETIMEELPPTFNSYTGVISCMGDRKFLKQSEDIVLYGLGITKDQPEALIKLKKAHPPLHTLITFVLIMLLCLWHIPSLESIDEHATIETFTSPIFKEGPLCLPPFVLGVIRLSFVFTCIAVTKAKIEQGCEFKVVRLPGSKLRGGLIQMKGWKTQGFYTSWAWNLLGASFLLSGLIPMMVVYGQEGILHNNRWILRSALITFEVAAPSAFLTSFVVTYALWPKAYKDHGSSGTVGFKGWIGLLQHCGNSFFVLLEVCLLGGLPVMFSHAAFAPIFAGIYQIFLWVMANHWSPKHGPVYPYFFMDTTLGARTTVFMCLLLVVIGLFFASFALLDMGIVIIEESGHGALPNVLCVLLMSYLLMKFKDLEMYSLQARRTKFRF
ncbi:hypothetical protein ACHAWF_014226 [Thalassiosira exigua]